jgi:hypothetical protein
MTDQTRITDEQTAGLRAEVQRLTAERDAERLRCAKIADTEGWSHVGLGQAIAAKIRSGE